ncbi:hypothetical protein GQ53DRAFT_783440 [Thozetella sp. PMI_491]|nr:hypothetical protein GQ53DRAFT_783440 [Thozetella sp. PMI_491]
MAPQAELLETSVTYEELADLERDFEDVEIQISHPRRFTDSGSEEFDVDADDLYLVRKQVELTRPLYEKREKTVSQIPHFWPLVFEQAPPDIDEYIQPQDSALLLSSLISFSVSHFEIEDGSNGDPRSVSISFGFSPNDYFEDKVIEKKFWYRRSKSGWAGLVSEPVEIQWKKGKDLTNSLLGLAKQVWDEEKASGANGVKKRNAKDLTAAQKALQEKIEATGVGATSFFAWFGYTGKCISEEENHAATVKEAEIRKLRAAGKEIPAELREEAEEEEDGEEDDEDDSLDVFPDGDTLAIAITDDLWPGAIKYFTQAQEQDPASDGEFESDAEGDEEDSPATRPSKKRKT